MSFLRFRRSKVKFYFNLNKTDQQNHDEKGYEAGNPTKNDAEKKSATKTKKNLTERNLTAHEGSLLEFGVNACGLCRSRASRQEKN
jgi:hypothetical protein